MPLPTFPTCYVFLHATVLKQATSVTDAGI